MSKFLPRHKPSMRPALPRSWNVYWVRNLQTGKQFRVYSEQQLSNMIANQEINDETHDVCIGVSAELGYSASRALKLKEQQEDLEVL